MAEHWIWLVWISVSDVSYPREGDDKTKRVWDSITVMRNFNEVVEQASTYIYKARILAVQSSHSSDWLYAILISPCWQRLDNEAIRVAVGLRFGLELCQPHSCPCRAVKDARGLHGLSCKMNAGRSPRHFQINDLIFCTLKMADIPSTKEPKGLVRDDGKKTWWPYIDSMEGWETINLGCTICCIIS